MKRPRPAALALILLLCLAACTPAAEVTPSPAPTPTAEPASVPTPTPTAEPTPEPLAAGWTPADADYESVLAEKSYVHLSDKVWEYYEKVVSLGGQANISPDDKYAAYISVQEGTPERWDLFVLDMDTGEETLLRNDPLLRYGVVMWLDGSHILCDKAYGGESVIVVVDTAGNEVVPGFAFDRPSILGARDGVIAYGNWAGDTICLARFNGSETLEELGRIDLDGTYRVRPGIDPFSPDGTRFACILVPGSAPYQRDLAVYDLAAGTVQVNETVPYGTKDQATVTEFHWLDGGTLLATINDEETGAYSSWLYRLPR